MERIARSAATELGTIVNVLGYVYFRREAWNAMWYSMKLEMK